MENSILRTINKELQDFKTKGAQIVPGLTRNQYETINKIYFFYNSKFTTGEIDDEGDKKYFLNINNNPCKVCTKAIDFDTKNIRLLTAGGGDPLKTWFMERDLKYWMRDKGFGKVLNRIFKELPIFGTVVVKVVNGEPHFVDLRNLIVQPSADSLSDSNYVTEIHNLTVHDFRGIAKEMKWDDAKVEKVVAEFYKMKDISHIKLFERYGAVEEGLEVKRYPFKRVFHADVGVDEFDQRGNLIAEHEGVELSSEEWSFEKFENTYWEFHMEKINGCWLGKGVVEALFEPQVRMNETTNIQAKATYWMGLRVFQTRDAAVNRNMLTDVRNGEVINTDSEITQVDMSDRNLAFFNQDEQKWMGNRDELTFSYDVVQGERLPAGTPLGSAQLAVSQTLSYFEGIQENVAMDVKEMLYSAIIPHFQKTNTLEHTLRLVGQDLDQYIEMVKNELVFKEVVRIAVNNGKILTNEEKDAVGIAIEESIKQEKEKILTIPLNFYKDVKYDVDIDITGESIDTRVRSATLFAILQAMTADPTMTTDPVKRQLLITMGEDGGLNMNDILSVAKKTPMDMVPQETQGAGGGVSAPMMNAPQTGAQTATV